jgi:hypothetical protein
MFIAPATASDDQFSYHEVNNSGARAKRLAVTPPKAAVLTKQLESGGAKRW